MVCRVPLSLTVWTVEGRAAALDDAAYGAAAAFRSTGLSLPAIDAERMLEAPEPAVGAREVAPGRAAGSDSLLEHGLDAVDEAFRLLGRLPRLGRQRAGKPRRGD